MDSRREIDYYETVRKILDRQVSVLAHASDTECRAINPDEWTSVKVICITHGFGETNKDMQSVLHLLLILKHVVSSHCIHFFFNWTRYGINFNYFQNIYK